MIPNSLSILKNYQKIYLYNYPLLILKMQIEVLRLSHRIGRDPRLSTHLALTARAFLANKIFYSGDKDSKLEETVNGVTEQFGGDFKIDL